MLSPDDPEILSLSDAADFMRCDKSTMRKLIRRGDIPATRIGSGWCLSRRVLMDMLGGMDVSTGEPVVDPAGKHKGLIYAVQTAPGRVKLGYTTNLAKRLDMIECHAGEATLLRHEDADRADEKRLHHACRDQRIIREFFAHEGVVADYVAGKFSAHDLPSEVSP